MIRRCAAGLSLVLSLAHAPGAAAQVPRKITDFPPSNVFSLGVSPSNPYFLRSDAWSFVTPMAQELMVTDGTPVGTSLVKAYAPDNFQLAPFGGVALDGRVVFTAMDYDSLTGYGQWERLHVTDGTLAGTKVLDSLFQGYGCAPSSGRRPAIREVTLYQGRAFYWRNGAIWSTDGETVQHQANFASMCDTPELEAAGGLLFGPHDPNAGVPHAQGAWVWRSDGTQAGTFPVLQGTSLQPSNFEPFANRLFFTARDKNSPGLEWRLWSSDGGPAIQVAALDGKDVGPRSSAVLAVGGRLFFVAASHELWVTDGAPGNHRFIGTLPNARLRHAWGDRLLASSGPNFDQTTSLWIVDPNDVITKLIDVVSVSQFAEFQGRLYFSCYSAAAGSELCSTDGTPSGTQLHDLDPGSASSYAGVLAAFPHRLVYVAAPGADDDQELYVLGDERLISVGNATVDEPTSGTATATFTVGVDPAPTSAVTVAYMTSNGTALAGEDYETKSGVLTFGPGVTTQTVDIVIHADGRDGPGSHFFLDLYNPAGALISRGRGVGNIQDTTPPPVLTASDAVVIEGTDPGSSRLATFVMNLSAASDLTVTVSYATMNADAEEALDYQGASGTITFAPGQTQQTVVVPMAGDSLDEPNETFLLLLSNVENATLAQSMAQGTILDDDGRIATCLPIAYVPYTITAQGRYCLSRNVSTAATTGAAISIESDFVDLDLRGFKIGGGAAGLATLTDGVRAVGRRNITVRNGNIRGFYRGVAILGASNAARVENVRLDENTLAAIVTEGTGHTIRRNSIVATGGTTTTANADTFGIRATGPGVRILNNDVTDTAPVGTGEGLAISASAAGGAVIEGNRVGLGAAAPNTVGIGIASGTDTLAARNRILRTQSGIRFSGGATGHYRDNLTAGVANPYTGGTDAGGNN